MRRRRSTAIKLLSLAVLAFYVGPSVHAAPGDIVSAGPPAVGVKSGAPKSREKSELVSSSGEATYSVPFAVPPGRNGAQPSIGLYYGSRAPLRGGVAAGWSMPIPTISVNTSKGWLGGVHYQVDGQPLVSVNEPDADSGVDTYRLWHDNSYTRYEHRSDGSEQGYWIARTTDGSVLEFGRSSNARDVRSTALVGGTDPHTPALYGAQGRWFLDQSTDRYGNQVTYSYQPVYGKANGLTSRVDEALVSIEYGSNTNVSGSFNHARIQFNYASNLETCFDSNVPIGAQFTYRGGIRRYEGASKLQSISAMVRATASDSWQKRRQLDLAYDTEAETCGAAHAPLRVLHSVTLSTWAKDGTLTALPASTFDYGPMDYQFEDLGQDQHDNFGTGSQMHDPVNNGYPGSFDTTADLNGDGVLEHLSSGWDASGCTLSGDGYTIHIPGFPWANGQSPQTGAPYYTQETCNAAAQIVHRGGFGAACGEQVQINNFRLMDMNGDGLPDLVTQLSYKGDGYNPANDSAALLAPIKGVSQYPACSALPQPMCTVPSGTNSGCLLDTPQLFSPNSAFSISRMSSNDGDTSSEPLCPKTNDGSVDPNSCRMCSDTSGGLCPNPTCKAGTECNNCNDAYCSLESWPRATDDPSFGGDGGNGGAGFEFWGGIGNQQQTGAAGPTGDHIRHMSNYEPCAIIPDMDCGSYVLRVYRNLGNGQFTKTPRMIYSPVPMSTQYYDGRADSGQLANAGSWSAFEDMDGDGYVNAVYQYPDQHSVFHDYGPGPLLVWRGNGTGNFYPAPDGQPYSWNVPATDVGGRMTINQRSGYRTDVWSGYGADKNEQPGNNHTRSEATTTLQDINGDGLPDLLYSHGNWLNPEQLVYFNTGTGFDPHGIPLDANVGANAPKIETTSRTITVPFVVDHSSSGSITDGYSVSTRRLLDMDGDGLPDVASMSAPKSGGPLPPDPYGNYQTSPLGDGQVWVHVNLGDRMAAVQLPSATAAQWYSSLLTITGYYAKSYIVNTDVVNEDGDGLPELQQVTPQPGVCTEPYFDNCATSATEARVARLPYHRLTTIDNGFGAVTTFHYASVRDPDVVTITDPQFRVESPLWVVSQIDVTSPTTPDASATYRYTDPVTLADDFGRVNFRGFRETKSISLAGAGEPTRTTIRRFDYAQDKLGHEVRRLVYDRDRLVSITDTSYVALFTNSNGAKSFQVNEVRSFACTPTTGTGAEASCIRENNIARTTTTWGAFKLSGIYVPPGGGVPRPPPPPIGFNTTTLSSTTTSTFTSVSSTTLGGSTTTSTTTGVSTDDPDPTLLWVPTTVQRSASDAGIHTGDRQTQSKFMLYYAASQYLLLPFDHTTQEATAEGTFSGAKLLAHDATVYDLKAHGFPTKLRHEINPGDFAETVQVPDGYYNVASVERPNQVYSGSGLTKVTTYDAAGLYPVAVVNELGQRTEADWDVGIGKATETRGPAQGTVMPYVRTDYDGLGRQIQQSRSHRFANGKVNNFLASYSVYHDTAAQHDVEHYTRVNYSNVAYGRLTDTFDAFGRIIKEAGSMSSYDETIERHYDGAGNLASVTAPDPSQVYAEAYVNFVTKYDGLGRPLEEDPPGRTPRFYDYGALTTRVYETPHDGTTGLDKTSETDVFGRLVRVDEGAATHAITTYDYDAMDRMVHIVNADGIPTDITYTLGGNRESVARIDPQTSSSQMLSYTYDHDGNRASVTLPHTGTAGNYTSTWSYDALDRVRVFQPATMDFDYSAMSRYALYSTVYFYDDTRRDYGVGRLTSVYKYGLGWTYYDHDLEGNVTAETRNLNVGPDGINIAANGTVQTTYNPLGTPQVVTYPDDPSQPTIARFAIDKRGRPQRMDLMVNGTWHVSTAKFDRNRAGLVVYRTSGYPELTEQRIRYDIAGRMKSEDVIGSTDAAPSPHIVAGEIVYYGQDGNVSALTDEATGRKLRYLYDDRSQLANVTSSPNATDYSADFTYSAAGSIDTARVQSSLPGAQVINRDVVYDYAGDSFDPPADPAAPRNLIDQATGAVFSHMTYDASGNMTTRAANSPLTMIYDGENQLREVINNATGAHEVYFYDQNGQRILTYRPPDGSLPATLIHRFGTTEITTSADGSRSTTTDIVLGGHPVARVTNHNATAAKLLYHGVLGSLVAVTDMNHVVRAQYGYGPYGEILYAEGPDASSFDRTYEDKARDAVSGLSYFGVRYYDPLTLGWTQADPQFRFAPELAWKEPRRMGLYTYVLNNPLRFIDPDGREDKDPWANTRSDEDKEKDKKKDQLGDFDGSPILAGLLNPTANPFDYSSWAQNAALNNTGDFLTTGEFILDHSWVARGLEFWSTGSTLVGAEQLWVQTVMAYKEADDIIIGRANRAAWTLALASAVVQQAKDGDFEIGRAQALFHYLRGYTAISHQNRLYDYHYDWAANKFFTLYGDFSDWKPDLAKNLGNSLIGGAYHHATTQVQTMEDLKDQVAREIRLRGIFTDPKE